MKITDQRRLIRLITEFMDAPGINAARHRHATTDSLACQIEQLLTDNDCFTETIEGEVNEAKR